MTEDAQRLVTGAVAQADEDWVPYAVRRVAPHLDGPNHNRRLLCDDRMKRVWPVLRKRAPHEVASRLEEHERRLMESLGLLNEGVSAADQACAAFVISVARTIWNPSGRLVWTKAEMKKQADIWKEAAAVCRWVANEPMFPEHHIAATEMADFFQTHADSLWEHGHLANLDQQIEPFVLERSSHSPGHRGGGGDDHVRGYTRAIAADAHRIFGKFMYGTVAMVTSVALQENIDRKNVENWCKELSVSH
jgi:hypothetical protein